MRFQLPQFIETEAKLIGPLTFKQFLWIASGGVVIFLLLIAVKGFLGIVLAIPVALVASALAFVKIDNIPLVNYVAYALSYSLNPKRYLYKNAPGKEIDLSARR